MTKKDMELRYSIKKAYCFDKCPFGIINEMGIIYVGSQSCIKCKHNKGNKNKSTLYCQKQGEKKELEAKK